MAGELANIKIGQLRIHSLRNGKEEIMKKNEQTLGDPRGGVKHTKPA